MEDDPKKDQNEKRPKKFKMEDDPKNENIQNGRRPKKLKWKTINSKKLKTDKK